jgi:hypothetical protein
MVADESVTFWPDVTDKLLSWMSPVPPVTTTVNPVKLAVPPLVLSWAFAAVPLADAATVDASKTKVQTAPDIVPPLADNPNVARSASADVRISSVPFAK